MRKPLVIKPVSQPNGDINVTPLVDVVLVLLIIFMVVTPLLEKDIKIALPAMEKIEDPKEIPPDQLVVKVIASGDFELNGTKIAPERYVPELTQKLATRSDKTVFVLADDAASYSRLVAALDGAKAAGAKTLGMAPDAPTTTAQ